MVGNRLERSGPDGDDLLRIRGADGRDRIARIDRTNERIGRLDSDDVGDRSNVEQRGGAREDVLSPRRMGGEDGIVGAGERDQQIGNRLGEAVRPGRRIGDQHAGDPLDRGRRFRGAPDVLPAHEEVNVGVELPGRRDRAEGRVEDRRAIVLGVDENAHQITFASFRSLFTSPATSSTMTPA